MSDLLSKLENQYCPPLDTATFLAIISDYDLSNPTSLADAHQTLDAITASADVEEATGFDPSGSSGAALLDPSYNETASENDRTPVSSCSYTDDTSLSQGLEGLEFEDDTSKALRKEYTSGLGQLDEGVKEEVLVETFPGLKPFDIKWTLKKCKGDVGAAIEVLLNQVFLEETGGRRKGIEAFEESAGTGNGGTKKKGKKKGLKAPQKLAENQESRPESSKWITAREDVEFLCQHTQLPMQQVSSLYHSNGGTLYQTISSIITSHQALNLDTSSDPDIGINAYTLTQEFPTLSPETCTALIEITHPSTSSAHALAKALLSRPKPAQGGITFDFRLPPPDLADTAKPYSHNAVNNQFASAIDPSAAASLAASYKSHRNTNFDQASAAYRRGKSDPLYSGVAAYYSSIGRDYDVRAKAATAQAAEALVAQQSSKGSCDLHGVGVKDAVRIARERVTAWWAAGGAGGGYRIVVGVGNHSEGGRGKLGPAVGKMLIREGWRVEVGMGILVVTGVVKKK